MKVRLERFGCSNKSSNCLNAELDDDSKSRSRSQFKTKGSPPKTGMIPATSDAFRGDPSILSRFVHGEISFTRERKVQRMEYFYNVIPEVFNVPREPTAYVFILDDPKFELFRKGTTVPLQTIITDRVITCEMNSRPT